MIKLRKKPGGKGLHISLSQQRQVAHGTNIMTSPEADIFYEILRNSAKQSRPSSWHCDDS